MWYVHEKYKREVTDTNLELLDLKGELDSKQAKISLAKFLRANLGFTVELISGIKLAPFQEVTLKGFFNRNFNMCVWGRGCGKTFIASVYCFLQCIFEPNTKILIAGPTFRTARFIFQNLEKIVETKGAELLAQAFGAKSKRNDQFEWRINGGSITAIPLSGEKIRGFRANILVLDEYLLLPEETIKTVLMPFLVAPQDMAERIRVREIEDSLIKNGKMEEKDRMVFENKSKMIALSSASYSFENLYKTYKEWMGNIYSDDMLDSKYFISQMGFDSVPEDMIDKTVIEEAQSGGSSNSSFQREYRAQFTDGSDSYFSAKKMHECTVPDGEAPHTLIAGNPEKEYILGIDPSFSNSPSSDYFAMSLIELDEDSYTLVHSYAVAGGDLKNHIKYLFYLYKNFNIKMIIIDNAGYQFIDSANESEIFREAGLEIKFFDFNTEKQGVAYDQELKKVKRTYSPKDNVVCFKQVFSSDFLRNANEYLQSCIDHKKIFFASRTAASGSFFSRLSSTKIPLKLTHFNDIGEMIETQDDLIYQTKKQCALIEVKSTAKGTQSFDLPQHLRRSNSANRARKDNYTTLMLGNWAVKAYNDMRNVKVEEVNATFVPRMID
ncbi:MAG: hypothetical protein CMD25_04045 [Flavobacteriales bacterium]|nr:hypothetical protein [Flavobacteriales bacterium]|tara:strand:- start:8935 stop:10758 length:1824 start_codon:yes stop_codon:yes gene_type:complete